MKGLTGFWKENGNSAADPFNWSILGTITGEEGKKLATDWLLLHSGTDPVWAKVDVGRSLIEASC